MKSISIYVRFLVILCLNNITLNNGEKILALSFYATKSHKLTYMPILKELGKRGHNITILTPIKPISSKPIANVTEILTLELDTFQSTAFRNFNPYDQTTYIKRGLTISMYPFHRTNLLVDLCQKTYDLPQVQKVMREHFDLIIFQPVSNECAWGMIYKMKAPVIIWFPIGVPGFVANKIGGYFPPSLYPHLFMSRYPKEMSFTQRFVNFGYTFLHEIVQRYYHEYKMEQVYWEKLGNDIPRVHEICADQTAMILSNGHFSLHGPKPYYPDVMDVGGIHSRVAKALPQNLEEFIEKGKDNGFIYLSFGTALEGSKMPDEKRKIFLKVFSKLKQQVIWKWETEKMEEELPENVMLSRWLPQQDILGHEKIKMFITHCGGGSTEEAIYHGSPMLGIPMFSDQPQNARLAKEQGVLVYLDWNELTEKSLMMAIQELLDNPQYNKNVKRLSSIMKDQPDHPLDRAVYWTEYVMRHRGAHHLRNEGRKMNFFQYHSYDVILCYLGIVSFTLYGFYNVFRFLKIVLLSFFRMGNRKIIKILNYILPSRTNLVYIKTNT